MTPAPGHSEDRGTEQLRLEVEQEEAETLEPQGSLEAAQGAEDGEGEVTVASVPGPGDQEQAAEGTVARPGTQEARGKPAGEERQTKRLVGEGMEVVLNQEAASRAPRRLEEAGREAQAEAAPTVFSRPVLTPVQGPALRCLGPVLLDAQKGVLKSYSQINTFYITIYYKYFELRSYTKEDTYAASL